MINPQFVIALNSFPGLVFIMKIMHMSSYSLIFLYVVKFTAYFIKTSLDSIFNFTQCLHPNSHSSGVLYVKIGAASS
jgi:hypothetical protein